MHNANLILADNPDFKFAVVKFQTDGGFTTKNYTYKTTLTIMPDDFAVVDVCGRLKVVKIVEVIDPMEVDLSLHEYKWLVSIFDTENYQASQALEKEINRQVNKMEYQSKREQYRAQLEKTIGEENSKLLVQLVKEF